MPWHMPILDLTTTTHSYGKRLTTYYLLLTAVLQGACTRSGGREAERKERGKEGEGGRGCGGGGSEWW